VRRTQVRLGEGSAAPIGDTRDGRAESYRCGPQAGPSANYRASRSSVSRIMSALALCSSLGHCDSRTDGVHWRDVPARSSAERRRAQNRAWHPNGPFRRHSYFYCCDECLRRRTPRHVRAFLRMDMATGLQRHSASRSDRRACLGHQEGSGSPIQVRLIRWIRRTSIRT
jgi:hypothetical protein